MKDSRARKMYLPEELLGVEKRISPTQVGKNHASYMKNLMPKDGANRKRRGWREIYHFTDENDKDLKINGIYEYRGNMIVHAGEYLYNGNVRIGRVQNKKSCGFENNGLLYIVCGGELYIYNGSELVNAYDSAYAYIPITERDISPIGVEKTSVRVDTPSLLTPKRINRLIGEKSERKSYRLDGKIDLSKPITVKTKMLTSLNSVEANVAPYNAIYKNATRLISNDIEGVLGVDSDIIYDVFEGRGTEYNLGAVEEISVFLKMPIKIESAIFEAMDGADVPKMTFHLGNETVFEFDGEKDSVCDLTDTLYGQTIDAISFYGSDSASLNCVSIYGRKSYQGELEIIHSVNSASYNEAIKPTSIKDAQGTELTLSNNLTGSQAQGAIIWLEKGIDGESVLGFGFSNVSPDPSQSNVEITYSALDSRKLSCSIGEVCKTDTGSVILALCNDNYAYFSCGVRGFGYFPEALERKIGTDEKITAICNMSDFSVGVFKRNSVYYLELNVKNGVTEVLLKSFSAQGGSLSHFATKTVNLDTLSPQYDNIYGSVGASGRVRRGSNIALDLKNLHLETASAVSHNGAYYLFVDGQVYVADSRYKVYENNRLDSSFEYEWWYLDGIYASYVAEINNSIYIGREDGRIVSFYEGYSDVYYEKIHTGSYLLGSDDMGRTTLTLNEKLGLKDCDRILISSSYSYLGDAERTEPWDGRLKLFLNSSDFWSEDGHIRLYPNTLIYLQSEGGKLTEAKIEGVDANEASLILDLAEINDTYTGILQKNDQTGYRLEGQGEHFVLLDEYGDYVNLCFTDNIEISCERRTPVECEYVTSAILSDIHAKKNVYAICVELLGDSRGLCEISYETDKFYNEKPYLLDSVIDFDGLDFASASFNSGLQKSHTVRCFERMIDYIIIKIKHSEDKMLSLKGYFAIYNERSLNG